MKTGAYLEQTGNASAGPDAAGGGACDAGKDLEKRGLAGAVLADNAEDFSAFYFQVDVPQCPDVFTASAIEFVFFTNLQEGIFFPAYSVPSTAVRRR